MFTTEVACAHGLTNGMLRHAVEAGRVRRIGYGAYAFAGVPESIHFELARAVALGGRWATVCIRAAAGGHDLLGGNPNLVEVAVPRWRRTRPTGWIIHESMDLTPEDRTTLNGLPITTVTRTLIDLGTWIPDSVVDAAVNDALKRGLTTLEDLHRRLDALGRRGRNGVGVMRGILKNRVEHSERAESVLESAAWRLMRENGLPQPVLQFEVHDRGRFIARLDGAFPELLVGIEVDGYKYHGDPTAQSRDRDRRNELESIGWAIVNVDAHQIRQTPHRMIERIYRLCETRARQLGIEGWPKF